MSTETKHAELCQWLRDNSSGGYRISARAADVIEQQAQALKSAKEALLGCLNKGSRWHSCDPVVKHARKVIAEIERIEPAPN